MSGVVKKQTYDYMQEHSKSWDCTPSVYDVYYTFPSSI